MFVLRNNIAKNKYNKIIYDLQIILIYMLYVKNSVGYFSTTKKSKLPLI